MAKPLAIDGLNIRGVVGLYLGREAYAVISARRRRWNCTYAVGMGMNRKDVLSNL